MLHVPYAENLLDRVEPHLEEWLNKAVQEDYEREAAKVRAKRDALLAPPPFCTTVGGSNTNPVGDYLYNGDYTYNSVLIRGGTANGGSAAGAMCGAWSYIASFSDWGSSARPRLKNP